MPLLLGNPLILNLQSFRGFASKLHDHEGIVIPFKLIGMFSSIDQHCVDYPAFCVSNDTRIIRTHGREWYCDSFTESKLDADYCYESDRLREKYIPDLTLRSLNHFVGLQ